MDFFLVPVKKKKNLLVNWQLPFFWKSPIKECPHLRSCLKIGFDHLWIRKCVAKRNCPVRGGSRTLGKAAVWFLIPAPWQPVFLCSCFPSRDSSAFRNPAWSYSLLLSLSFLSSSFSLSINPPFPQSHSTAHSAFCAPFWEANRIVDKSQGLRAW